QCWDGRSQDGTLPQAYSARYFMISGVSFFYGGWNELALFRVPATTPLSVTIAIANSHVRQSDYFLGGGSFVDVNFGASDWSASIIDFGDGSPASSRGLSVYTDKTFAFVHQYIHTGTYPLTVRITDNLGNSGSASVQVTVDRPVVPFVT